LNPWWSSAQAFQIFKEKRLLSMTLVKRSFSLRWLSGSFGGPSQPLMRHRSSWPGRCWRLTDLARSEI